MILTMFVVTGVGLALGLLLVQIVRVGRSTDRRRDGGGGEAGWSDGGGSGDCGGDGGGYD